jgi:Tfp pilus assembly protein PilF
MRGFAIFGAVVGGLLLAGCSGQSMEENSAWRSIVSEDYSSARDQYTSILAGDPNDPYANLNIGVAYEELGDLAMAAKHYQIAIDHGAEAQILKVAQDGKTANRTTTVKAVATENLARVGG